MREQHDTHLLDKMVESISDKIRVPAKEIGEASARRTREVHVASEAVSKAAEADARKTVLYSEGRKVFVVFSALSLFVVAIGFAGWLILSAIPERIVETRIEVVSENPVPAPNWPPAFVPDTNSTDGGIVTTNFTLFREKIVKIGSKEFKVVAGHDFATETDTMFSNAWCYTNTSVDALDVRIQLGNSQPNQSAIESTPTEEMLETTGLTRGNINTLFQECQWLDGNPNVKASIGGSGVYQFSSEVSEESVDHLIAAIAGGASVVEFSSPGGLVDEAIRGFSAIRNAGMKTVATGECASACSLMFLGGTERTVSMSGSIGVHQWRTDEGTIDESEAQMTSATLIGLITSAGVSEEFYIAGARTPPNKMYNLTRSELVKWGVVRQSV
ncbi:hypothetical protein AB9F26_21010 [Falsihalocynthiibacter sp. BN13B15]|uniref:COG3904 family protein n=1 Tax=Falsihalocynthiibacter sp. BN13B15 TaxID=3240871 RepID=UPI00350F8140